MANISHGNEVMSMLERQRPALADDIDFGVRASWHRSAAEYGLEPDRVGEPDVLSHAELLVRRAPVEELSALSSAEIDRLFQRLVNQAPVVMLTDAQGVVVHYRCSASVIDQCTSLRVLPGSIWTEESQGTTGIGLCLRERRPVSVVMSEHFATKLAGLSCTVAPIFGANGRLAATLNVSSVRHTDHAMHSVLREMVANSARRIENHFFDRRHSRNRVLRLSRHDDFCDSSDEARLALDDRGRIIDATPLAHWLLSAQSPDDELPELIGQRLGSVDGVDSVERLLEDPMASITSAQGPIHVRMNPPLRSPVTVPVGFDTKRGKSPAGAARPAAAALDATSTAPTMADMVGSDPTMSERLRVAQRVHARGLPLLLQGESGSGKTQLARALHAESPHRAGNFVSINCAAIPQELIESELFGYRPGAFTGAAKQGSPGRIVGAHGGTLFLDEIGDMPLALQGRLLQVLSEGEFVPVGATEPVQVRFALISATLRDLPTLVREGRFREDLYYRISGATLALPALRERADRMALIESAFARASDEAGLTDGALTPEARHALSRHTWPGNFRELQHVARFAVAIAEGPAIDVRDLPAPLGESAGLTGSTQRLVALAAPRGDADPVALASELQRNGWNVSAAAAHFGVSRATLHRRLIEFKLRRPRKPSSGGAEGAAG